MRGRQDGAWLTAICERGSTSELMVTATPSCSTLRSL
jgi:hypothetical protein